MKAADPRLAELLKAHFHAVWRAVRRFGVPLDVADDAAQEVFIVAARKLDTIEPGGELRFLYGVALRIAANARRARLNRREHGDEEALLAAASHVPRADALLEAKQMRELLDLVLDELEDDLRTVFVLFELEGWGENSYGQAAPPDGAFTRVAVTLDYSCALGVDGAVRCWGGDGAWRGSPPEGAFTAVAVGEQHACALRTDRSVVCWGSNNYGQLAAPTGEFETIAAGAFGACAIRPDQSLTCWGLVVR